MCIILFADTAESDGLTTEQAVAITVPVVVVTILLVTACAVLIIFLVYAKFRYNVDVISIAFVCHLVPL